jgi:hypothetical protein
MTASRRKTVRWTPVSLDVTGSGCKWFFPGFPDPAFVI